MDLLQRKSQALSIARKYSLLGYDNYARRMEDCLSYAHFKEKSFYTPEYDDYEDEVIHVHEERKWRLVSARFCRIRHCPVCQWRRAMRWQALTLKKLSSIGSQFPHSRWLFLTLTVRNCLLTELKSTIQHLNQSFKKLTLRKAFPAFGWLKSLEVSLDNPYAHPHFHCLLMVDESYFSDNYLEHEYWCDTWKKVAKLNYNPSIHISAVPPEEELSVVSEILKYSIKPSDLAKITPLNLYELTNQLHHVKAINKGGILRDLLQDVNDDTDLIGSDGQGEETGHSAVYRLNNNGGGTYEEFYHGESTHFEVLEVG